MMLLSGDILCLTFSLLFLKMNSVYGLLSTEAIHTLPKVVGQAYFPFYPGCIYAALPATNGQQVSEIRYFHHILILFQGFTITYYNSRPDNLIYHINEYHVFDLKV